MKVALCDDMSMHREMIKPHVLSFFEKKRLPCELFEFDSGTAIEQSGVKFDIVFLDMELGDKTGIEVAKKLKKTNPNLMIIVVTSYVEYLDDAMDLRVIRFLNKPVTEDKIFASLERTMQEIDNNIITIFPKDSQIVRLKLRDIIYAEARLKNVFVYTTEKNYCINGSLNGLRQQLTSEFFAVPHNSFIINLNYISNFRRDEITLAVPGGEVKIPVTCRKQHEFKRIFLNYVGEVE